MNDSGPTTAALTSEEKADVLRSSGSAVSGGADLR